MASMKMSAKGDKPAIEIIDNNPDAQQETREQAAQAESDMRRRVAEMQRMAMEALQSASIAAAATQPPRKPVTEAEMAADEKAALDTVSAQDRTRVRLPVINKGDPEVAVTINGARYTIKRGVTVELPRAVVEVLEHADML